MFARCDEVLEALELVTSDVNPICSTLKRQVLQEVRVKVLFQGEVSDKAHATDAAIELNSLEDFDLGSFTGPETAEPGQ